jgi:putative transposase
LSIQRACRAANLSRAAYYRAAKDIAAGDEPVIEALNGLVAKHGRWGFWKCHERLRLDGHQWNHKRTWRIYRAMRLNLPRRARKRLVRPPQPLDAPLLPNEIWALDFMSDSLYHGRRFRTLNILDEGVREALAIEIDTSLPAERVVRTLQQLAAWRGLPKAIRLDNGLSKKAMARDEHTSAVARGASKAGYDCAIVVKAMQPGSLRGGAPSRVRSHSSPADAALDRRRHCG